jgi:hypothetical protein
MADQDEDLPGNIVRDQKTVSAMLRIYCQGRHGSRKGTLCADCTDLEAYAHRRLAQCPFGPEKTTCRECPVHCYRPVERKAMVDVMRYAGPRMTWRHALLALRHLWIERKGQPALSRSKARRQHGQGA